MATRKHIINTFFNNLYTDELRIKFYRWLSAPYNIEEKDSILKSIWDDLDVTYDDSTIRSLKKLEKRLNFKGHNKPTSRLLLKKITRIAAIFILPLISALITYLITSTEQGPIAVTFAECFVPYGEIKTILLPDSTTVTVNSGSTLIYPEKMECGERYVYLNGEAYFEVKNQNDNPFKVKIDGYEVEVLGTKFNVCSYSDDPEATTTLKEGKVKVNFRNDGLQPITLQPTDHISYNKETNFTIHRKVSEETIASWRQGHFIFQRASIFDILKTFERRYGITVYLNSNRFDEDVITVKFIYGETLEESFKILKEITPSLQYKISDNKAYVF